MPYVDTIIGVTKKGDRITVPLTHKNRKKIAVFCQEWMSDIFITIALWEGSILIIELTRHWDLRRVFTM